MDTEHARGIDRRALLFSAAGAALTGCMGAGAGVVTEAVDGPASPFIGEWGGVIYLDPSRRGSPFFVTIAAEAGSTTVGLREANWFQQRRAAEVSMRDRRLTAHMAGRRLNIEDQGLDLVPTGVNRLEGVYRKGMRPARVTLDRVTADPAAGPFGGRWRGTMPSYGPIRVVVEATAEGCRATAHVGGVTVPSGLVVVEGERLVAQFPSANYELDLRLAGNDRAEGTAWLFRVMTLTLVRDPDFKAIDRCIQPLTAEHLAYLRRAGDGLAIGAASATHGRPRVIGVDGADVYGAVTTDDLWRWGSITKSMTATLAAVLVEEEALSWETTVGEVLGDVPGLRESYLDASLLQLLSHRAGVVRDVSADHDAGADPIAARLAVAGRALAAEPVGRLGARTVYSNAGYVVAAAMMEQRLRAPWEALITERLFDPLRLTTAGFGEPPGWNAAPGAFEPSAPAGGVHMSLADMLTYLEAHRDQDRLLEPASWNRLHAPPSGRRGYALGLGVIRDGRLSHGGAIGRWRSEVVIDPELGLVAAAAGATGPATWGPPPLREALWSATVLA